MGSRGARRRTMPILRSGQTLPEEGVRYKDEHARFWFGYCISSLQGHYKGWPSSRDEIVEIFGGVRIDAANASIEERATLADLRLIVGGQNVTMHLSAGAAIDHVTVPLYGVAEGLAHDWWTLFGSRDDPLSLVRYRDGFALPDVRMSYDGAAFEIRAEQRAWLNPDIRFWGGSREIMDRAAAEEQLERR